MAISKKNTFSRRLPDLVTEELVAVLSEDVSYEFKELFEVVHARLRARNAASGGEEMLRLRAYEKLQSLVNRGMVKKLLKKYSGLPSLSKALPDPNMIAAAMVTNRRSVAPADPAAAPASKTPRALKVATA